MMLEDLGDHKTLLAEIIAQVTQGDLTSIAVLSRSFTHHVF